MKWFKKLSNADPAKGVRELDSLPRAEPSETQEHLTKEADKLNKIIDPDQAILNKFAVRETNINGVDWVIVDDVPQPGCSKVCTKTSASCYEVSAEAIFVPPAKSLVEGQRVKSFFNFMAIPMGIPCPKKTVSDSLAMTDKEIGNQSPKEYFGLSDASGIIVRFNVVEYRQRKPKRSPRKFTGIDYPGKMVLNEETIQMMKADSVGMEAKEKEITVFIQMIRSLCKTFRHFVGWFNRVFGKQKLFLQIFKILSNVFFAIFVPLLLSFNILET